MEKLFITGGCGYVGSVMIPNFLDKYIIKNVDTQWFANKLKEDKNLTNIKADIRNLSGESPSSYFSRFKKFLKSAILEKLIDPYLLVKIQPIKKGKIKEKP